MSAKARRQLSYFLAICIVISFFSALPVQASTNEPYISKITIGKQSVNITSPNQNDYYLVVPDTESTATVTIEKNSSSNVDLDAVYVKAFWGRTKDTATYTGTASTDVLLSTLKKALTLGATQGKTFDQTFKLINPGEEGWLRLAIAKNKDYESTDPNIVQNYYIRVYRSVGLKSGRNGIPGQGISASQGSGADKQTLVISDQGNNTFLITPPAEMDNPRLLDSIDLTLTAATSSSATITIQSDNWTSGACTSGSATNLTLSNCSSEGDFKTAEVHVDCNGNGVCESTVYTLLFYNQDGTPQIPKPVDCDYAKNENGEEEIFSGRHYLACESDKDLAPTFNATPTNSGNFTWQWYKREKAGGWQAIDGATSSRYTPPALFAGYTYYYCKVTNVVQLAGNNFTYSADSDYIRFTVKPTYASGAEVVNQTASANLALNQADYQLIATAKPFDNTDSIDYKFEWYRNGTNSTSGGTKVTDGVFNCDTYVISSNSGLYSYVVADTSQVGSAYYYCKVTTRVPLENGGYSECESFGMPIPVTVSDLSDYFQGNGTESEPFKIQTADDFEAVAGFVNSGNSLTGLYFVMTADITLPENWSMIGRQINEKLYSTERGVNVYPFSGNLDGGNHTLTIPENGLPLFRYVREASVSNLIISGVKIAGAGLVNEYFIDYGIDGSYTAGVPDTITITNVTLASGSSTMLSGFIHGNGSGQNNIYISNSEVQSNVTIGYNKDQDHIASFAGHINGIITNCKSAANVYGTDCVGGIAGEKGQSMGSCTLSKCAFTGSVTASGERAGGILASGYDGNGTAPNAPVPSVFNCYVSGTITAADYVGGIYGIEPECEDCWENGAGFVACNAFYGHVTSTNGNHKGAISAFFKSFNENQGFTDCYFVENCGADKALGSVEILNGDAGTFGTEGKVTVEELTDGTLLSKLNASRYSGSEDWIQGEKYPVFNDSAASIVSLNVILPNGFQTEYYVGDEEPSYSGVTFSLTMSDGTTQNLTTDDVRIEGFDSSKQAVNTITVAYKGNEVFKDSFQISILKKNPDDVEVSVAILGDALHNSTTDGTVHTLSSDNLTPWIATTTYTLNQNATVKDLFEKLLSEHNELSWENPTGNYIESFTYNGVTLGEFTNSGNSGWMYTYNGALTRNGVAEQFLSDGDCILAFYTDDYTKEGGIGESAIKTFTLSKDHLDLEASEDATKNTATLTTSITPTALDGNVNIEWISSAPSVATVSNGVVTAKSTGTATITVTAGSVSRTCSVSVDDAPIVDVTSIALDKETVTLKVDETATLTATVLPENATDSTVTWTSSAPGIASVENGVITAKASGTATITAKAGEKTAECLVIVKPKEVFGDNALGGTAKYVYETVTAPRIGDTSGDWVILGLARSGYDVPNSYYQNYYGKVESTLTEKGGVLNQYKYTEYSRVILALTAIGKDPTDVAGYNLLEKLADYDATIYQGVNGPIWALIALDSGNYDIPQIADTANQATRDRYVARILECQLDDGSWAQGYVGGTGTFDPDMTAMALQALAKYRGKAQVDSAIEKALTWLSENQSADGGYSRDGEANAESVAQVIVALNELGISLNDARFVKNENGLLDSLLTFRNADGSFRHVSSGTANQMATEQALYALVSADRADNSKPTLYRMTDPLDISEKQPDVAVSGITLDQDTASVEVGKTITLVATVEPDEATDKTVTWESASPGTATVVNGVVKGIKVGDTVITAKAGDYSATCTVTVAKASTPIHTDTKITVKFSLLGDNVHDSDKDGRVHGLKPGGLTAWIASTSYELEEGATVKDLLEMALTKAGMTWENPSGNYVESITYNGETLGEFTNGKNSGWMYTLNGDKHPNLGVAEQVLSDGDVVTWHYTDDYTKENDAESWGEPAGSNDKKDEKNGASAGTTSDSNTITADDGSTVTTETTKTVETKENEDGSVTETVTETTKTTVTAPDGSVSTTETAVETETTTNSVKNPDGTVTETEQTVEKVTETVTAADGTKQTTVTETEESKELNTTTGSDGKVSGTGTYSATSTVTVDGKTTTAVTEGTVAVSTDDKGTVSEVTTAKTTTTAPDGTKTETVAVITEAEMANGTTGKVVADEQGNTLSAEASVSQAAVEAAAKSGAPIEIPVTVNAASGATVSISLEGAGEGSKLWVEIGTTETAPGNVAYLKLAEGVTKLLTTCKTGSVIVPVTGNCEVIVKDNSKSFSDVDAGAWYGDSVKFVTAREIFNGVGDGAFAPSATMNRAMAAQILYNLDGEAKAGDGTAFSDVKADDWFNGAVGWASGLGVITGYDGAYSPLNAVTRQDLVTILYRYAKQAGYNVSAGSVDLTTYADGDEVASYAAEAMRWAIAVGLIKGYEDNTLRPTATATRAEVAAIMQRMVQTAVK